MENREKPFFFSAGFRHGIMVTVSVKVAERKPGIRSKKRSRFCRSEFLQLFCASSPLPYSSFLSGTTAERSEIGDQLGALDSLKSNPY